MQQVSKPWYESVTVWGIIIALLATVAQFVGLTIAPDVQTQLVNNVVSVSSAIEAKDWVTVISALGSVAGLVMALFGRNQAAQPVHYVTQFTQPVDGVATKAEVVASDAAKKLAAA